MSKLAFLNFKYDKFLDKHYKNPGFPVKCFLDRAGKPLRQLMDHPGTLELSETHSIEIL